MVRNFPRLPLSPTRLCLVFVLAVGLLAGTGSSSTGQLFQASDHTHLHHRKHQVQRSIDSQKSSLEDVSRHLMRTQARLADARTNLSSARADLAGVQAQVRAAIVRDQRMQARLDTAIERLKAARDDLTRGRDRVKATRAALASYAVSNYQTAGSLTLGVAFGSTSTQQVLDHLQASKTVLDKQSSDLQRLQATEVLLKLTTQRVHESKVAVQHRRALAAQNLQHERDLEAQARSAEQAVASRVSRLRSAKEQMAAAKQQERHRLEILRNEQQRIDQRLHRIAERRAHQQARQRGGGAAGASSSSAASSSSSKAASVVSGSGYLSLPLHTSTYVTSPYGMRMHPILHIWELHDGTDFYAACGTPVYAAADGRVMSEYFNAGYGNVLLLDNGIVHGVSLSTSYNHLARYVVSVGASVQRGQLIAYSGDTGWSTGCHLHFSVFVNGSTVDPMTWL